jgi:menaquinone-9 beta-reductase
MGETISKVLIAGGGLAGSSLAILLGRQGIEVEIFERHFAPFDKPCGEGLMPAGVGVLERMGLLEAVGGEPFYSIRYHHGARIAEGRFPRRNGKIVSGRGQRRLKLDEFMFQTAAATPNVRAHRGCNVNGPLIENGRVTGLIVDGTPRRASLVVAADGIASPIRKALRLDAPVRRRRFGLRTHFRIPRDYHAPWVDVFLARGYELYVTTLPDREVLVAALVESELIEEPPQRSFMRWCMAEPSLADRLDGAEQVTDLVGCSPLSACARHGVTPGAVLLGDAAGFLDPVTGGGMSQALASAELLSGYIARDLVAQSSRAQEAAWLAKFDHERNALLRDYRRLTSAMLWLARHPWTTAPVMRAMHPLPRLCSHLAGVSGDLRPLLSALPAS